MQILAQLLSRLKSDEDGLETIEYALVASLIVLAVVVAMAAIGPKLQAFYEQLSALIP